MSTIGATLPFSKRGSLLYFALSGSLSAFWVVKLIIEPEWLGASLLLLLSVGAFYHFCGFWHKQKTERVLAAPTTTMAVAATIADQKD